MKFYAKKSEYVVNKKGKVHVQYHFGLGEETISTVSEKPVKSLGGGTQMR